MVELRGRDAVVAVGAMKLTVPIKTLKRVSKRALEPLEIAVPLIGDQPEVEVRHEVDLRGMRVDEAEAARHAGGRRRRARRPRRAAHHPRQGNGRAARARGRAARGRLARAHLPHGRVERGRRRRDHRGAVVIPDEVVEQVAQAADIVAIIGEHVRLKKVGSVYRGPCPFHQGTNNNFSVLPKGGYTCFVCGEKGSVFTFVQKRLGLSFVEAVKYVGEKSGIEVREVERRREGPDPREPLWELERDGRGVVPRRCSGRASTARRARDYLARRNVSRETADRFGLGFAPRELGLMRAYLNGLGFTDDRLLEIGLLVKREEQEEPRPRFRDRLIFPILDAYAHTVGFGGRLLGPGEPKYLNSAESEVFSKGKLLYNLSNARHAIRRDERVILVEGYFDVVRLVDAGLESRGGADGDGARRRAGRPASPATRRTRSSCTTATRRGRRRASAPPTSCSRAG